MNADGTGHQQVPTHGNYAFSPTWSPDGTRIAYVYVFIPESGAPCRCHIHTVEESNLDGSQSIGLYGHFDGVERFAAVINDIEWSPKGDAIAITRQIRNLDNSRMLMVIGPNGNRFERTLTGAGIHVESPAWSPDGERLAFSEYNFDSGEIYTMKPDGTGRQRVTNNAVPDQSVEWSPNGQKFVVAGADRNCQNPRGHAGCASGR